MSAMACGPSSWGYPNFDPLWNAGASSVERDALRERERQARAQRAGLGAGETGGHPIFRAPIKVDPGQEDEISRRIKSTLGDFSQVQRLLTHDPNHLIGISRTNAALSSSRGGSSSVPPSSAGPVTSAPPGPAPTNGVGSNASTWNGTATDPGGTRVGSSSKHHGGGGQHQPPPSSHHTGGHRSHHSSSHHHHSHHHHHKKQQQPQSQQPHQPPPPPPPQQQQQQHQQPPPLSNGQYKSSSSSASQSAATKGSRHPHAPQLPPGSHHPRSSQGSSEQGRPDRTEDNPSERPKPAAPPPNGLVVRPPAMRVPSKDVNNGASSASHSSSNTSSSLTVRTESNGPVNSGGKAVAPASRPTAASSAVVEAKAKRPPPPRLQLPSHATDAAEMKKVPPALTAIETPRKEDCRPYFPPSPVQEPLLNHLDENGDSKGLLDSRKAASPPGSSLQDDLEMSDSDDEQEPPLRKSSSSLGFSSSKITPPNEKVLQPPPLVGKMSSSESSSSDSEDSSSASGSESESESSESEASAPETSREPSTQSWKLANFIDKRSSPAALGAVLPAGGGCSGQSRGPTDPCDSLVDEDSFTPILSQFPNQDPDLGLMLKSPSPQGLDLVRSPVGKAASFLSPVRSSPSQSPAPERHEPPAPVTKSSVAPASDDDEGPCQLQNGRITMRLGKPQGKTDLETPLPKPDVQLDPTVKRASWPSKGSKKETAQLPLPTPATPTKQRSKPDPVAKPEPAREPAQPASNPSKRTHSDRYNEKRSKLHKPRVVLSDSSSDDEGPSLAAAAKERLSSAAPTADKDRGGSKGAVLPQRGRPKSSSSSRSAGSKGHKGAPPAATPGVPRTPPEPPVLLSPIGQRCDSSSTDVKESVSAAATNGVVVVNIPLSRLLRPPGRLVVPGRRPPSPPPSPSKSREHSRDAEPGTVVATAIKSEAVRVKQEPPVAAAPASKGKSTSKRKSTGEAAGGREREKKRRLSAGSSGSVKVKREPSDVRPEEEAESRHAWGPTEPHRSCGSPSSLSSYSSQRSGSRQHRSKPSSSKTNRSDKSAVRRDAASAAAAVPADAVNGGKKNHHHHHREKKETSRSSKDGAPARGGIAEERGSDPTGAAVAVVGADPLCSSQVHSWVLSSSEQGDARSRDASGAKAASLGAPPGAAKAKENPHLLSHNSHREWESKNGSSDYFLCEAKKLKHQADRESDRTVQAMKYLEAVLYFILTGSSMEHSHHEDNAYLMYKETLALIRWGHISSKFQKVQGNDVIASIDNKLAVLSLRCLSLLYEKLYKLRKNEVRDNLRLLHELQKTQGSVGKLSSPTPAAGGAASRLQPSPCQPCQPSPHSPTPSPAGSVGSQSSGYSSCELGNNNNNNGGGGSGRNPAAHHSSAVASVAVPQAQYTLLQRQSATLANLHHCHDKWEQADYLTNSSHSKEFFAELDRDCGKLTLHSSSAELVRYVREGVFRLRHRLAVATGAASSAASSAIKTEGAT
ncbi:AF4/FMR2 family member 1 isoform X3 [Ixodes scapularis]|uniref:AF4/FMR2 family member 1 isoform X3 n=1 Tax=Ixodes scapularis TaxID=6945 RepID=UPI001A9EAA30|nr:AF4/FMR2 family member 1 isoform X3 [Ixodes scapularis]